MFLIRAFGHTMISESYDSIVTKFRYNSMNKRVDLLLTIQKFALAVSLCLKWAILTVLTKF